MPRKEQKALAKVQRHADKVQQEPKLKAKQEANLSKKRVVRLLHHIATPTDPARLSSLEQRTQE